MYDEWDCQPEPISEPHDSYYAMFQRIKVSQDLGREELFELGRAGIYHRISGFVNFPVNIKSEIEL